MRVKDSAKKLNSLKGTLRYFGDKGIYLVLINLLPSLLLPFVISPSATMYYLFEMDGINTASLGELFASMWKLPYEFWYIGFIGIVLLIPSAAISFDVIDRHMRIGEFTVSPGRIKTRLNYNLLTAIKFVVVAFVALEFYNVVGTLLYYLWANVCSERATALVFSVLTLCIMEFCMICTMAQFILWPPYMLHTGMRSGRAFKAALSSMSGRGMRAAFSIFIIVLPIQIVMIITAALNLGVVCRTVLDGIAYAIVVPYYLTLMYNIFYDVTGTERMDLEMKKNDIWSKK